MTDAVIGLFAFLFVALALAVFGWHMIDSIRGGYPDGYPPPPVRRESADEQ